MPFKKTLSESGAHVNRLNQLLILRNLLTYVRLLYCFQHLTINADGISGDCFVIASYHLSPCNTALPKFIIKSLSTITPELDRFQFNSYSADLYVYNNWKYFYHITWGSHFFILFVYSLDSVLASRPTHLYGIIAKEL